MSEVKPHILSLDEAESTEALNQFSEQGRNVQLATVHQASMAVVRRVLDTPISDNGRSPWVWVRLSDGTLVLGIFPKGTTYEACELDACFRD